MTGCAAHVAEPREARLEFQFGGHLHESPKRSIREIETHEVCPGRETAPGFFHVRDPPPRAALDAQPGEHKMTFVDHYLRALEAKDFEQRLHMLEGQSPKGTG